MGRILPASKTGCTAKSQRRLGRAIRRARALGFMPIWSRHPSLTQRGEMRNQEAYGGVYSSPDPEQFAKQFVK